MRLVPWPRGAAACLLLVFASTAFPAPAPPPGTSTRAPASGAREEQYAPLPAPGKKAWVDAEHYFTYEFDKKPSMGPLVVKIRLFGRDGKRTTDLEIKGSADMPSMRGAHYSGDQPFRLSKKGDYLLPVDVVMPGDWEVRVIFSKGGRVLFRGALTFGV